MRRIVLPLVLAVASAFVPGCGSENEDPDGAKELWDRIHRTDYRKMARAPGYETRRPTRAPHGESVDIYVNAVLHDAYTSGKPLAAWPEGSLIVKDGFEGAGLSLVAAMEKRGGEWFWAEWDASGEASFSGQPKTCTGCHASGSDFVRAFDLPK